LDTVADLLARDGVPTNPLNDHQINQLSERRRGIRRGGKMVFFSLAMFLPVLIFSIAIVDHPFPMVLPGTLFLAGLFWMLYYRLFGEEYMTSVRHPQVMISTTPQNAYLPPSPGTPVYHTPVDPPKQQSVVENTTRSLGQQ
jgi:hypothetical protein